MIERCTARGGRTHPGLGLLVVLLGLHGAQSHARTDAAAPPPAVAVQAPAGATDVPSPTGALDLVTAVRTALARNPGLAVGAREIDARAAAALQAGLPANPELQLNFEDLGGSGDRQSFEQTEMTLLISQLFQLGGKRAKRAAAAERERDVAAWDWERARADVTAATAKAFVTALATQARIALARDLVGVADTAIRDVQARIEAGATSPVERTRADVTRAQAEVRRLVLERELAAAYTAVARQWGDPRPTFERLVGNLEPAGTPPALETSLAAAPRNPDVTRWDAEIAQREAAIAAAEARAVPDVTLGAGPRYFRDNDDVAFVVQFGMPLPLVDRNQGGIAEARARALQAASARRAAETEVRAAIVATHALLEAAAAQLETLRDDVLPGAERAHRGVLAAYGTGLGSYLEVLDAQRTLFALRDERLQALESYQTLLVDLARATGAIGDADAEGSR